MVIVTHNSASVIEELLDSLPAGLAPYTGDIVVVDNASSDDTLDRLVGRSDCTVVRSANVGYSGGINRGVREAARAPAILVLNPDVRLRPGAVAPMMKALEQPGVGIVAPQIRSPDDKLDFTLRREPTLLRALGLNRTGWPIFSEYVGRPDEYVQARDVDWAVGAVQLMSRECFEAVGGWDESYFLYSEETQFCISAGDRGFVTRYAPEAVFIHDAGQSGRNDLTHVLQIVNRIRFYRRRHAAVVTWIYYLATVASELSWVVRGHRQSRAALRALLLPRARPVEAGRWNRWLPV